MNHSNHFSQKIDGEQSFIGKVKEIDRTPKFFRLIILIQAIINEDKNSESANGRILVYIPIEFNSLEIGIGDELMFKGIAQRIPSAKNPKAFDFRWYMHTKNIHFQAFIKSGGWKKVKNNSGVNIFALADKAQRKLLKILKKHLANDNQYAVASALILGDKSSIGRNLRSAYADTGAMHILAVSGLHVGFIYLFISWALRLVKGNTWFEQLLRILISIIPLWLFVGISGASASVMRAATMFSFLLIGKTLGMDRNIYNILGASAFILICVNPFAILDVGFQLSYLALLGIVYFQPKLYRKWYFENKLLDNTWKLMTVGIAAQITTFPISIYYFHQFPLYFWLSGILAVPAAAIIFNLGLSLFLTNWIPGLGVLIGTLLSSIIEITNTIIFWIAQLPLSTLNGIWLDTLSLLLLYGIIIFLVLFWEKAQKRWLWTGLLTILLLLVWNAWISYRIEKQDEIVIYHQSDNSVLEFIQGRNAYTFTKRPIPKADLYFINQNYHAYQRVNSTNQYSFDQFEVQNSCLWANSGFFQFGDHRLAVIDSTFTKTPIKIDFALVHGRQKLDLKRRNTQLKPRLWIFDGSNPYWVTANWTDQCVKLNLNCVDLNNTGALILKKQ